MLMQGSLSTGVAVEVEGAWIESPNKSKQTQELRSRRVTVLGDNDANVRGSSPSLPPLL